MQDFVHPHYLARGWCPFHFLLASTQKALFCRAWPPAYAQLLSGARSFLAFGGFGTKNAMDQSNKITLKPQTSRYHQQRETHRGVDQFLVFPVQLRDVPKDKRALTFLCGWLKASPFGAQKKERERERERLFPLAYTVYRLRTYVSGSFFYGSPPSCCFLETKRATRSHIGGPNPKN